MSKDGLIRFRSEVELKTRLKALAKAKRTDLSEFIRQKLWQIVEAEESAHDAELKRQAQTWLTHSQESPPLKSSRGHSKSQPGKA